MFTQDSRLLMHILGLFLRGPNGLIKTLTPGKLKLSLEAIQLLILGMLIDNDKYYSFCPNITVLLLLL